MPESQFISYLGQSEGYSIGEVQRFEPGPGRARTEGWIELRPDQACLLCCSGRRMDCSHGLELRFVQDLYATTVVDPNTKRVLWAGQSHTRANLRTFFELSGEAGCRSIRAVVMDMSAAYDLEVSAHSPQAEIFFDQFQIVAKYGQEVIDLVRVDEVNRLRHSRRDCHIIKSSRWLLLRTTEALSGRDHRPKEPSCVPRK